MNVEPLRILYIAYPLLTVSENSVGGAEQVLWTLEREMAIGGALTTVAASSGSRVTGELFSTGEPCSEPDDFGRRNCEHQEKIVEFVRRRAREGRPFDLIHDHSSGFWPRAAEIEVPVLATLHLPRHFYYPELFQNIPPNVGFICVSHAQARSFSELDQLLGVAPNGIALDLFRREKEERTGLLWMGRICQEKGPHLALEIAQRAASPITLAGQVYPFSSHQHYFENEILPRLDRLGNAHFVQSPSAALKRRLLAQARALLITSQVDETSSLVAMEAAASGTPVIAFRRGALPEVVRQGSTGLLVDSVEEGVAALEALSQIRPETCIQHAGAHFSSANMAGHYARFYGQILHRNSVTSLQNTSGEAFDRR
jgi:glycosyltransferase involved in cell wall biosynthesis